MKRKKYIIENIMDYGLMGLIAGLGVSITLYIINKENLNYFFIPILTTTIIGAIYGGFHR